MRITVLGGCGAWPAAGQACGGYLLEYDGFRLLLDPGYATLPRLLELVDAAQVDAVLVSHGHPDHCADLHPLLRARVLAPEPPPPLLVYAPAGAVDAVLALDGAGALDRAYALRDLAAGERIEIGPFHLDSWLLPHFVPNLGVRLRAGGRVVAYTGDTGPSPDLVALARDVDLFLAEASFADRVPLRFAGNLSSAREAGEYAQRAGAGQLLLTHLWPGEPEATVVAAAEPAAATTAHPVDLGPRGRSCPLLGAFARLGRHLRLRRHQALHLRPGTGPKEATSRSRDHQPTRTPQAHRKICTCVHPGTRVRASIVPERTQLQIFHSPDHHRHRSAPWGPRRASPGNG